MSDTSTRDRLGVLVAVALALLVILPLVGMGTGMLGGGHMWGSGPWGGPGGMPGWVLLVGLAMQLLVLVALVGGAVLVYRAITGGTDGRDSALEELRLAYARGDLSDEEFERRRERLERDTD